MANIHDVAKLAGVSPTTAKRAIREPGLLAPATLERVRRAIDALHYEPDQIASALRSGQNRTVGLVIGNIVEPFFASLTRSIGTAIHERNFSFVVADSEYRADLEAEHLRQFYGIRISGLIIRPGYGDPNLEYLLRMQRRGTAIVEIDFVHQGSPFSHVMLDNRGAVESGVGHLVAAGHRRIAALGSYHPEDNPDERSLAFPEAMASHGLPLPASYRHVIRYDQQEAHAITLALMRLPEDERPTALFALTGTIAVGAFMALRELGLRVPHDVSLLTFDNYPWTELVEPGIDVIEQPVSAMGRAAVDILFGAIAQDEPEVVRRRFPARLLRRGSVAPPAA